jgi:hypothetical protein
LMCQCKLGYFGRVTGNTSTCTPCPIGSFCPKHEFIAKCDC